MRSLHLSGPAAIASLLFLLSICGCSSFNPEPNVPQEEDWIVLPTDFEGGYFFLPMEMDGNPDHILWFLYDTGASYTVVDPDSLQAASDWDSSQGRKVRFGHLQCGDAKFSKVSAKVMSLSHLQAAVGREFDGILAYSVFADVLLNLDYPNGRMRIAEGYLPRVDDETVFKIYGDNRPYVDLSFPHTTRRILIDSGSGLGFEVNPSKKFEWAVEPLVVGSSMGIDGLQLNYAGRLNGNATIFNRSYRNPVLCLSDDTQLVGTDILRDYAMTFDQRAQRLELIPSAELRLDPIAFRGTGAIFKPEDGGMVVLRLMPGSPAEKSGMLVGDHVERAVYLNRMSRLKEESVSSRTFFVRRGGKRFQLEVPVVALIPVK